MKMDQKQTPEQGGVRGEVGEALPMERLGDSLVLFRRISADLTEMLRRMDAGEDGSATEMTKRQKELEAALRLSLELEKRLDERSDKENGLLGEVIDFDATRRSIRCKLGRLRRCSRSGRVFE